MACKQITSPAEFQSFPVSLPRLTTHLEIKINQPSVDRRQQIRGALLAADALAEKAKAIWFGFAFSPFQEGRDFLAPHEESHVRKRKMQAEKWRNQTLLDCSLVNKSCQQQMFRARRVIPINMAAQL